MCSPGLMARFGVPVGGRVKKSRAFEDRPGYPLKRERNEFGGSGARSMRAVKGWLAAPLREKWENRKTLVRPQGRR